MLVEWPALRNLQITCVADGVEKREPSHTVGGNVNWCSPCREQHGDSSKTSYHMIQ